MVVMDCKASSIAGGSSFASIKMSSASPESRHFLIEECISTSERFFTFTMVANSVACLLSQSAARYDL